MAPAVSQTGTTPEWLIRLRANEQARAERIAARRAARADRDDEITTYRRRVSFRDTRPQADPRVAR